MVKSSNILELKNQPGWLVRTVSLIVLIFVFSLLAIIATGAWDKFGIAIILFIALLFLIYGVYFFSDAVFSKKKQ